MVVTQGHLHLPGHEVYDAEAALNCYHAMYSSNLHILLDNKEAALQLQGTPGGSSPPIHLILQ